MGRRTKINLLADAIGVREEKGKTVRCLKPTVKWKMGAEQ